MNATDQSHWWIGLSRVTLHTERGETQSLMVLDGNVVLVLDRHRVMTYFVAKRFHSFVRVSV